MLSQERLKQLLSYDPDTGVFVWRSITSNRVKIGDPVGNVTVSGYLQTSIEGRRWFLHKLVFLYLGEDVPLIVDHIDRDRRNNRRSNLRPASHNGNQHNRGMDPRNTSGAKGVYWDSDRGKWHSQLCVDRRVKFLGRFDQFEDAVAAVKAARVEMHKEFANHGD